MRILPRFVLLLLSGGASAQHVADIESPKTGAFTLSATSVEAVGAASAAAFAAIVPDDKAIEWQIVVPENYDAERPPGVLVHISPSNSGMLPREWARIPESQNLIWIAANESGNRSKVARRIAYALFAVGLVNCRYEIDDRRIYLSGFSGGARVSGLVAAAYPQLFSGYVYIGGAEPWENEPAPDVLEAMVRNRYAFVVGMDDANRNVARRVASRYSAAGIENVELMIISRLGHAIPPYEDMLEALNYLDGRSMP